MANTTDRRATMRAYHASLTPEQKEARRLAIQAAAKAREAALTPEQRQARSDAAKARYAAMPENVKARMKAAGGKPHARGYYWTSLPEEEKARRKADMAERLRLGRERWLASLTPEQKEARRQAFADRMKARRDAMTSEEKEARRAKSAATYSKRLIEDELIPNFLEIPPGEILEDILAVADIEGLARETVEAWMAHREREWARTREARLEKRAAELRAYLEDRLAKSMV